MSESSRGNFLGRSGDIRLQGDMAIYCLPSDRGAAEPSSSGLPRDERPWCSLRQAVAEVVLVFAVFFVHAARPVPDVNEPYYVGKAIHYWNPDWVRGDFFLETPDAHVVFCFLFGWAGRWLEPQTLAWTGRVVTWLLLAWAWCRVGWALRLSAPYSLLGAMLFVLFQDRGQMAGEWIIGGVEAKGVAYVFVLLGLAALLRDCWASAWIFFGLAAAFHVLVGGWAALAAGLAWLMACPKQPRLKAVVPGLVIGGLLALPGLIPALMLDRGVDAGLRAQAHQIYVFQRLAHHLVPHAWSLAGMLWFAVLVVVWLLLPAAIGTGYERVVVVPDALAIRVPSNLCPPAQFEAWQRLRAFVNGSLIIFMAGLGLALLELVNPAWAAAGLRYYWFRLADVMLPVGVAFGSTLAAITHVWRTLVHTIAPKAQQILNDTVSTAEERRAAELLRAGMTVKTLKLCAGWIIYGLVLLWSVGHLGSRFVRLLTPQLPPAFRLSAKTEDFLAWRAACRWIATSGRIPPEARFLTPRMNQTFKWYARRGEVVNRKEVPQDAASVVEWWDRLCTIHATGKPKPHLAWYDSLEQLGAARLRELGRRYGAAFAIAQRGRAEKPPALPVVYRNRRYVIYRLD